MKKKIIGLLSGVLVAVSLVGVRNSQFVAFAKDKIVTKYRYDRSDQNKAEKIEEKNRATEKQIAVLDKKIAKLQKQLKKYSGAHTVESVSAAKLASLNYSGKDVITVNNNEPSFSKSDLSTSQGAWQRYGELDNENRVTAANALLNQKLMPKAQREPLHVNPTGWHNKRVAGGWLYNRCHLIGYQLTGQNNNLKNLMTGTRQLNDPDMLRYEDQVANYLKESPHNYVRYRVTPIFRGQELLARGVEMEGQSTNSNSVHFNVYIFNVADGVKLNYADGTSQR
ncbi:DNA/RNA non-specific endonuclease [Lactobacillus intestinalis]|uniref:Prophage Lp1 protein 65 n=1 Tax=Lactobacillus intestinalis DSM 6629 TaxID=1423761 RepID=A0ABR5PMD2_9LACO|nr:DNA/RNA non-specific endonuclease [Lactobacillus intestinalis]KRM31333.1 prophage Lp1 protein 65 [Lactobacillus intestinalis DSM 6629]UTW40112.1 DNA/RNA non-specific endonuclease [Lactobacillus intestinalis]